MNKTIIKLFGYCLAILVIVNFIYFFIPFIPQRVINPCQIPPCPNSIFLRSLNIYIQKNMLLIM